MEKISKESGKTISNLDRDIVAKIFGSVNVFTTPAELRKKLENTKCLSFENSARSISSL